jgi:hypothetical protein
MPSDVLEAQVQLTEVGTTYCLFDISLINQSHGNVKIAAGLARYALFTSATDDLLVQTMPQWLIPTLRKENL